MKKKHRRRTTASTKEVALWVEDIPEVEWSDFVEVEPGRWYPHPDAEPKLAWLKDELTIRMAEIDAYEEEARRTLQTLGEKWIAVPLRQ